MVASMNVVTAVVWLMPRVVRLARLPLGVVSPSASRVTTTESKEHGPVPVAGEAIDDDKAAIRDARPSSLAADATLVERRGLSNDMGAAAGLSPHRLASPRSADPRNRRTPSPSAPDVAEGSGQDAAGARGGALEDVVVLLAGKPRFARDGVVVLDAKRRQRKRRRDGKLQGREGGRWPIASTGRRRPPGSIAKVKALPSDMHRKRAGVASESTCTRDPVLG